MLLNLSHRTPNKLEQIVNESPVKAIRVWFMDKKKKLEWATETLHESRTII